MLHTQPALFRTTYTYTLNARTAQQRQANACTFSAIRAGDLLLVAFDLSASMPLIITAQSYITVPDNPIMALFIWKAATRSKINKRRFRPGRNKKKSPSLDHDQT